MMQVCSRDFTVHLTDMADLSLSNARSLCADNKQIKNETELILSYI